MLLHISLPCALEGTQQHSHWSITWGQHLAETCVYIFEMVDASNVVDMKRFYYKVEAIDGISS